MSALRADMLRFARLQLRDRAAAEDAVQEAIEAALRGRSPYAGQSQLRTWLFGILNNKIGDQLRRARRYVSLCSLADGEEGGPDPLDAPPCAQAAWADPEASLQSRQFWARVELGVRSLPGRAGQVFLMRDVLGFELDEVCACLGISANNCHVILHRARTKLRAHLDDAR